MSADLKMLESIQNTQSISREELGAILQTQDSFLIQELHKKAQQTATQIYGNIIYIRGLIEFTNYCKNNCYYCGIRNGNTKADRYRLTTEQILSCCKTGWNLGFRTFVLQTTGCCIQKSPVFLFAMVSRSHRKHYPRSGLPDINI